MTEITPLQLLNASARQPGILRRLLRRPLVIVAVLLLALIALVSIFAPWITPYEPTLTSIDDILKGPSAEHLLGTDSQGRDALSRVIAGSPLSVVTGLFALLVALVFGVGGGLIAGYFGGWFDGVSSWLVGVLMALPAIVMIVALRAIIGPSLPGMMFLLGLFLSPTFFRLTYGAVRAVREELYVDAARVSGLNNRRIIGRHVLSAVRAPIIIQAALVAGMSVNLLAGLEFLGLGDPDSPTWGSLLSAAFTQVHTAPWLIIGPSIALAATGIAFVLLGNGLRDELERVAVAPRRRGRRAVTTRTGSIAAVTTSVSLSASDLDDALEEIPAENEAPAVIHPEIARAGGDVLLSVRDLRVSYAQPDGDEVEVVHGVSLDLREGEIHGLIGESGSGKTQTAFSMLGLLPRGGRISGGEIRFRGQPLQGTDDAAMSLVRGGRIGYVPQEPMSNLDPSFTIGSQLTHPLRYRKGMSKAAARDTAIGLLERVGIPDPARIMRSYPFEVSGGMAQRILIAGAVSMDPEILIADEPTTALDVTVQAEVLDLLRELQQERNLTMLLVTHNVGVVADLCNRVTVMRQGRFVESGPVGDVLTGARHPYTRSLLSALLEDTPARGPLSMQKGDR